MIARPAVVCSRAATYTSGMGMRTLRSTVAVATLAIVLTACTASPAPDDDLKARVPSAVASPTSASARTPVDMGAGDTGPCSSAVPAYPGTAATDVEQLGGATLAVPFDRGPMTHAAGEAVLDDQGIPVAYRVAANDVLTTVGARFCVGEQWLYWVNYVRRDGDALFAGDTLNLDAHTILSVGDQNGVVHGNALPEGFVIPPQR